VEFIFNSQKTSLLYLKIDSATRKKIINTIHDFSVLPLPIEAPMKGAFFVKEFYGRNNQDSDRCTYLSPFEQLTQTS